MRKKNSKFDKLCILMSPDKSQRFNHSESDVPKWFSLPLEQLCETHFAKTISDIRKIVGRKGFLVFNVSLREVFVALWYGRRNPICSLFQWIPLDKLPRLKRFCYEIVLRRSVVIVTYNKVAYDYIKNRYPGKRVFFLRLWVDTEYFKPCSAGNIGQRFLLCPGSHRRDEALVCKLAKTLGVKIVRFSQAPEAIRYYSDNSHDLIDFRYDISFEEMRQLYAEAAVVLNIVDDQHIPAGLTCFIEALSMDCTVITPSGHSSAGYQFSDGKKPYYAVSLSAGFDEWSQMIRTALDSPIPSGEARQYVEQYASVDTARKLWREVLHCMNVSCVNSEE